MFIWILAIIILMVFAVINWAVLGEKMNARAIRLQLIWAGVALVVWRLSAEGLKPYIALEELVAFVCFMAVLCAGYYQLHIHGKRASVHAPTGKKPARKKSRKRRA